MLGLVTPVPYLAAVLLAAAIGAALCVRARRRPGPWTVVPARLIALVLVCDAISFVVSELVAGTWSPKTDLPFALCDAAVLVAAAACWWRKPLLVEHILLGPCRYPAGCHHSRPQCRIPPPCLLPVSRRSPGHRPCCPLPRRRDANRAPSRIGDHHLRDHPRLHGVRWSRRRVQRSQLHVPSTSARELDAAEGPRAVALVHRQRRGPSTRPARRARLPLLVHPPPPWLTARSPDPSSTSTVGAKRP